VSKIAQLLALGFNNLLLIVKYVLFCSVVSTMSVSERLQSVWFSIRPAVNVPAVKADPRLLGLALDVVDCASVL